MAQKRTGLIALLALMGLLLSPVAARADLTITPVRVVFQGRDRSATVELLNMTDRTNTYRMSWLEMKADDKGRYTLLPAAGEKDPKSVANMVIFTPRQVTIEPHGHQLLRLSLRRPADLPSGEYRAHLAMTRIAKDQLPQKDDPNAKQITMALYASLGFSIPIIVRSGDDKDLKVSLVSPTLAADSDKKTPVLNIDLHRDAGKFSSYGGLTVYWQPPKGAEQEIGQLNNVALYPEVQERHLSIPLSQNPTAGSLKVAYLGKYESEGKTWAETSFPISK